MSTAFIFITAQTVFLNFKLLPYLNMYFVLKGCE